MKRLFRKGKERNGISVVNVSVLADIEAVSSLLRHTAAIAAGFLKNGLTVAVLSLTPRKAARRLMSISSKNGQTTISGILFSSDWLPLFENRLRNSLARRLDPKTQPNPINEPMRSRQRRQMAGPD
jgi:hypothetical protein